jgi:hypothetical protein
MTTDKINYLSGYRDALVRVLTDGAVQTFSTKPNWVENVSKGLKQIASSQRTINHSVKSKL